MGETLQRTSLTGPDHLVVRATAVRFSRLREMRSAVPLLVSACPSSAAWIGDVLRGIAEIPDAVWWLAVPGRHHVSVNPRLPFEERIALALESRGLVTRTLAMGGTCTGRRVSLDIRLSGTTAFRPE